MSSLTAFTRHVARRLGLPTRRVLRAMDVASAQLGRIRHPNALLFGGVLIPVIAFGFSFGDRMVEPRYAVASALGSVAASTGFAVNEITIEGIRDTREGDVLDYLAVTPTTSLLGFDIKAARTRVLALPWVKEASVRRVYPDTLLVDIEEHAPFARMLQRGRIHLVTVDGEEITSEIGAAHAALPLVVGEGAPQEAGAFFAQLADRPFVLAETVALERIASRRWTLHMTDKVQVHLPEEGVDAALGELESLMRRYALLDRAITAVDMRQAERLVVRLTDAAMEAMSDEASPDLQARGGA